MQKGSLLLPCGKINGREKAQTGKNKGKHGIKFHLRKNHYDFVRRGEFRFLNESKFVNYRTS
jgi:hypothetical protein